MAEFRAHRGVRAGVLLVGTAVIVLVWAGQAQAEPRAWPIDLPTGERYYLFAVGGGGAFPEGHKLEIWKETNGLRSGCSIRAALPVGHVTTPEGDSGLQLTGVTCDGVSYEADTRIFPTPDEQPPPPPPPPPASPEPTPSAGVEPEPVDTSDPPPPVAVDHAQGSAPRGKAVVSTLGGSEFDPVAVSGGGWNPLVAGLASVGLLMVGARLQRLRDQRRPERA